MGYVATKGGEDAIANANQLVEFYRVKERTTPIEIAQIQAQFRLLIDKIMGEGSLYAPEHAALVLKQNEGDVFESAFMLRAYRATLQRRYYSETLATREMFVRRRISSAFREIPGGRSLGRPATIPNACSTASWPRRRSVPSRLSWLHLRAN
jgi:alpha-D-ribose 1-methylphosphonate 5-triphosphate synthase subunit PhnI